MARHSIGRAAVALAALALCSACAMPPGPLRHGSFSPVDPRRAATEDRSGERVRWGGTIAKVEPARSETCLEIVGRPLDARARPELADRTIGRFRACASGFLEPEIYAPGRRVTIVGVIRGRAKTRVGRYELDIPVVSAEVVYLWPPAGVYYPPAYPYVVFGYPYAPYPYYGYGWSFGFGWPYWY